MLQTVTPIDHFPLSFLGLWRIEPLAVAIKQQRQRHAVSFSKQIISIISISWWFMRAGASTFPKGKLFAQFC
ncbi:hypothetical protein BQ8482_60055 [Mesorhizobium delmotii]|uniref:Uncharacterized protein n=1 Tax=Mesorhizobium delmotii TaxID=1631247 RepID=A0A2P9AVB4_9HYPH|nr:hypothetical protein BQ8482_60055 [Mesorhizobium delmotii]